MLDHDVRVVPTASTEGDVDLETLLARLDLLLEQASEDQSDGFAEHAVRAFRW